MDEKKHTSKYTAGFRERGVRLFREQRADYTSEFKLVRASGSNDPGGSFEGAERGLPGDRVEAWLFS